MAIAPIFQPELVTDRILSKVPCQVHPTVPPEMLRYVKFILRTIATQMLKGKSTVNIEHTNSNAHQYEFSSPSESAWFDKNVVKFASKILSPLLTKEGIFPKPLETMITFSWHPSAALKIDFQPRRVPKFSARPLAPEKLRAEVRDQRNTRLAITCIQDGYTHLVHQMMIRNLSYKFSAYTDGKLMHIPGIVNQIGLLSLLHYIYGAHFEINQSNAVQLLKCSLSMEIPNLANACIAFFVKERSHVPLDILRVIANDFLHYGHESCSRYFERVIANRKAVEASFLSWHATA
ncbi:MAG: BTB/POZ domain-containing protein [Simkaniaceae bacterium]|nr:BTB/POZ domain-containing protein [Simkaniaceae bacterium]